MRIFPRSLIAVLFLAGAGRGIAGADSIEGYIVNPVDDRRVADVEVSFSIQNADGAFAEMMRKSSDEEGRFSFSGPFLAAGLTYMVTAHFRDVAYPSSALVVGAQRQVILEVFEPTDDPGAVHIAAHHLFLAMKPGILEVAQLMQIHNSGETTFVGSRPGGNLVTELRLPTGAFNFRAAGAESDARAFVRDGESFYNTDPVLPDHSQIAFTFELDLADFSGAYEHVAPYDTEKLELYVQPVSIQIGPPFTDLGPVTLHDQTYRRYQLDNLPQARPVTISLPLSRPLRWVLKWAALGLTVFAAVTALGLARRGGGSPGDPTSATSVLARSAGVDADAGLVELQELRERLLSQLARVGDQDEAHRQLIDRTVALYRLLAIKKAAV